MTWVVDASVAIKWFIAEPGHETALAVMERGALAAPELLLAEVTNVAAKKARRGEIAAETARAIDKALGSRFVDLYPLEPLSGGALDLALALEHHLYDCLYLTLAQRLSTAFLTFDAKFHAKAEALGLGAHVELLSTSQFALSEPDIAEILRLEETIKRTQDILRDSDPKGTARPTPTSDFTIKADRKSPSRCALRKLLRTWPPQKITDFIAICSIGAETPASFGTADARDLEGARHRARRLAEDWPGGASAQNYVESLIVYFERGLRLLGR